MQTAIHTDPVKYFGFTQCYSCLARPCRHLRSGLVQHGNLIFIPRRYYSFSDCPLAVKSFREITNYLKGISLYRLKRHYESIIHDLTEIERYKYNRDFFCSSLLDRYWYIEVIIHLWKNRVITAVGIPIDFEKNPKMRRWFLAFKDQGKLEGEVQGSVDIESSALTDSMVDETAESEEQISITDLSWEHTDDSRKSDSPESVYVGDTVIIKANVADLAEGAEVSFDIYDTAANPPIRIDTVKCKNEGGTASAEWLVEDTRNEDEDRELKIEFEAVAKGNVSKRTEIKVGGVFKVRLQIDPNSEESKDDKFTLYSTDSNKTYQQVKTVKDDKVTGDNFVDLIFTGLDESLSYTLEIDTDAEGKPYYIFENRPFGKWIES